MKLPRQIVNEILDKGLAESTWRETHPLAYLDLLTYREDIVLSFEKVGPIEGYHFFTSSQAHWRVHTSLYKCLRNQRRADRSLKNFHIKGCDIYMVPGPLINGESNYEINNYRPQVEGAEHIHYEEY